VISDKGCRYRSFIGKSFLKEARAISCGASHITQSMSKKRNCMDNSAMENFFGRLKLELFYGEQLESIDDFIQALKNFIDYYNNERISLILKGMSPVQYRTHSQAR